MPGRVVTFYSYKGGVGRTFSLANVAIVLARWGYRVLCIDWDLDAPGLRYYYSQWLESPISGGLVESFHSFAEGGILDFNRYIRRVGIDGNSSQFYFLAAGADDQRYFTLAQKLDWTNLYSTRDLGLQLEQCRAAWMRDYDIVLIDSRTGVTDIGGICTAQLPDVLIMLLTASNQSLEGTIDVARRAQEARDKLPYDRSRLMIVPVPSKFDAKEEYRRANEWRDRFNSAFGDLVSPWLHREVSIGTLLSQLTIPYIPYWSFGDEIAVRGDDVSTPGDIAYTIITLAALIAHGLDRTELLTESRDLYVSAASRAAVSRPEEKYEFDVMLSYGSSSREFGSLCGQLLRNSSMRVLDWYDRQDAGSTQRDVSRCRHCVAVLDRDSSSKLPREVEIFIRQSLDDEIERQIFPVAVKTRSETSIPTALRHYRIITVQSRAQVQDAMAEVSAQIEFLRRSDSLESAMKDLGPHHAATQSAYTEIASSQKRLGDLAQTRGELAEAEAHYRKALNNYREAGHQSGQGSLLTSLGDLAAARGDLAAARSYYDDALVIFNAIDNQAGEAQIYRRRGDLAVAIGDLTEAHAAYQAALDITARLAAIEPANAHWQRDLQISQSKLGDLATAVGDLGAARAAYQAGLDIASRLATSDTGNTQWQRDLSINYNKLGDVAMAAGDPAAARAAYQAGLDIRQRLITADPANTQWQRDLSISHNKLGDVAVAVGDLAAARTAYQAGLDIAVRLAAADPANTQWQRDLSVSYDRLGDVAVEAGDLTAARTTYQAALDIAVRLAAADPANIQWQRDLSVSYDRLGNAAIEAGDLTAARTAYQAGLDIRQRLAAADPANTQWQQDLWISHNKLGDVAVAAGDLTAARTAYQAGLDVGMRLAAADPANIQWQQALSISHNKLGDMAVAAGDLTAARTAYQAALDIRQRLAAADPANAQWQWDLSVSYDRLGNAAVEAGDLAAGRAAYQAELDISEQLSTAAPANTRLQEHVEAIRARISELQEP